MTKGENNSSTPCDKRHHSELKWPPPGLKAACGCSSYSRLFKTDPFCQRIKSHGGKLNLRLSLQRENYLSGANSTFTSQCPQCSMSAICYCVATASNVPMEQVLPGEFSDWCVRFECEKAEKANPSMSPAVNIICHKAKVPQWVWEAACWIGGVTGQLFSSESSHWPTR